MGMKRVGSRNGHKVAMHDHAKVGKHGFSGYMINRNAWCGVERESMGGYDDGYENERNMWA